MRSSPLRPSRGRSCRSPRLASVSVPISWVARLPCSTSVSADTARRPSPRLAAGGNGVGFTPVGSGRGEPLICTWAALIEALPLAASAGVSSLTSRSVVPEPRATPSSRRMRSSAARFTASSPLPLIIAADTLAWPLSVPGAAASSKALRPAVPWPVCALTRNSRGSNGLPVRRSCTPVSDTDSVPPEARSVSAWPLPSPPSARRLPSSVRSRLALKISEPPLLLTRWRVVLWLPAVRCVRSSVAEAPPMSIWLPDCQITCDGMPPVLTLTVPPESTRPLIRPLLLGVISAVPETSIVLPSPISSQVGMA